MTGQREKATEVLIKELDAAVVLLPSIDPGGRLSETFCNPLENAACARDMIYGWLISLPSSMEPSRAAKMLLKKWGEHPLRWDNAYVGELLDQLLQVAACTRAVIRRTERRRRARRRALLGGRPTWVEIYGTDVRYCGGRGLFPGQS